MLTIKALPELIPMFKSIVNRWWLACFLVSAQIASAQPSGQAAFAFGPENAPLWDLSSVYSLSTSLLGAGDSPIPLSYTVVINHGARGTLSGEGTTIVRIDNQPVAAFYNVRGSVSGGGDLTRANFSVSLRGRDWIFGAIRSFQIKANYQLEVDPASLQLVGRIRGSGSISGLGGGSIRDDEFTMPVPAGADGTWAAVLNFIPFKSFAGTGSIVVSHAVSPDNPPGWPEERVMAASVKGSYSSGNNRTKATLQTLYEDRGASLTITFFGENELSTVRGKVLGQKVRVDAPLAE